MELLTNIEVFLTRENSEDVEITHASGPLAGQLVDFSGATSFELVDSLGRWTVSSITDATYISIGSSDGVITFKLGNSKIPPGVYVAALIMYDAEHTAGNVIGMIRLEVRRI